MLGTAPDGAHTTAERLPALPGRSEGRKEKALASRGPYEAVVDAIRCEVVPQTEAKAYDHERYPGGHDRASAIPLPVPVA